MGHISADKKLAEALQIFCTNSLYEGAIQLLSELGIRSERLINEEGYDGSLEWFYKRCERGGVMVTDKRDYSLKTLVEKIFFLFQVTSEEINLISSNEKTDDVLANSVIFIAAEIHPLIHPIYHQDLEKVTLSLNQIFPGNPIISLFRYGRKEDPRIALATALHRRDKRRPERIFPFSGNVIMNIKPYILDIEHKDFLLALKEKIKSDALLTFSDMLRYFADASCSLRILEDEYEKNGSKDGNKEPI